MLNCMVAFHPWLRPQSLNVFLLFFGAHKIIIKCLQTTSTHHIKHRLTSPTARTTTQFFLFHSACSETMNYGKYILIYFAFFFRELEVCAVRARPTPPTKFENLSMLWVSVWVCVWVEETSSSRRASNHKLCFDILHTLIVRGWEPRSVKTVQ